MRWTYRQSCPLRRPSDARSIPKHLPSGDKNVLGGYPNYAENHNFAAGRDNCSGRRADGKKQTRAATAALLAAEKNAQERGRCGVGAIAAAPWE